MLRQADVLQAQYASADAYEQALSETLMADSTDEFKIPTGTAWKPPTALSKLSSSKEAQPDAHEEEDNFQGDRVLANSILFVREFMWWIELKYAIPEGDIGQIWEVIKV